MYQLCIIRRRSIRSWPQAESPCETGNAIGAYRRCPGARRSRFARASVVSASERPLAVSTRTAVQQACPANGMFLFEVSMHVFVCRSKVRPVRLKLPILRFHGEEVTIHTNTANTFHRLHPFTRPRLIKADLLRAALSQLYIYCQRSAKCLLHYGGWPNV
jgi:hypothetical protein